MFGEAHAHLFMNGYDYRKAVETHKGHIEERVLRGYLEEYRKRGVTFIRDGGDDLGVSSFRRPSPRNTGSITGHRPCDP